MGGTRPGPALDAEADTCNKLTLMGGTPSLRPFSEGKMPSSRLSFTDKRRMGAEGLETAALRELLSRRRAGEFVGAEQMDVRLARMVAKKRRIQRELGERARLC